VLCDVLDLHANTDCDRYWTCERRRRSAESPETIERRDLASLRCQLHPPQPGHRRQAASLQTFPDVGDFAGPIPVTVGICVEIEHIAQHDAAQLSRLKSSSAKGSPWEQSRLSRTHPRHSCHVQGSLGRFSARSVCGCGPARYVSWGRGFAPSSAYAAHVGAGGLTGSFSRIGWMLPTTINFRFHAGLGAVSHPIRDAGDNTYAGIVTFTA